MPPRVEYELTDLGMGMFQALAGFANWLGRSWPRIEEARNGFDEARRSDPKAVKNMEAAKRLVRPRH